MTYTEKIANEYKKVASCILGLTTVLSTIAYKFIYPWINLKFSNQKPLDDIINFLINLSFIYSSLFLLVYLLYEKIIWKLLNRKDYYGGYWKGSVTYVSCINDPKSKNLQKMELPFTFEIFFKIEQTPFRLNIIQGISNQISEKWHISNVEISDKGEFSYLYYADRTVEKGSPIQSRVEGREVLKVVEYDHRETPIKLSGYFHHLSLPNTILFNGKSNYKKISKKEAKEFTKNL